MIWSGGNTGIIGEKFEESLVFLDDNHLHTPPLTSGELSAGTYVKLDHYAVEWYEEYPDGNWGAIISERKTTCMWPEATIASQVYVVGTIPEQDMAGGLYRPLPQPALNTPDGCHQCDLTNQPWFIYRVIINYFNTAGSRRALIQSVAFGGISWESMRYLASNKDRITPSGFTAQDLQGNTLIGKQKTFMPVPQWYRLTTGLPGLADIKASGPVYGTTSLSRTQEFLGPLSTLGVMTELQNLADSWRASGAINVSAQTAFREAVFGTMTRQPHPDDLSICCYASDIHYMNGICCNEGGLCGGRCCPDDFECNPFTQQCVSKDYYCMPS